jgi:DNA-directed RNA polymerase subunit RPC12/RpoP
MKCADCGEEILQRKPQKCPYCGSTNIVSVQELIPTVTAEIEKLKKEGNYEEAAVKYEEIEMYDKAEECRKLNLGKIRAVTMECPHCGKTQQVSSKDTSVRCKHCGKGFGVPKKVLELF